MRRICWLLPALLLAACGGQEDMDSYVAETKARPPVPIEPLPELKPFAPMHYQQRELRSPFMIPQPEAAVGSTSSVKVQPDCAQTLLEREKRCWKIIRWPVCRCMALWERRGSYGP